MTNFVFSRFRGKTILPLIRRYSPAIDDALTSVILKNYHQSIVYYMDRQQEIIDVPI